MNRISSKPIFIHALFKTGSTFLWSKFRKNKDYHCYYEPFHHFLLEIDKNFKDKFIKENTVFKKEPTGEEHYLTEYADLIREKKAGLPFFKRSFIVDAYCENTGGHDVKQYIDSLVENSGEKRTVLQFNRTALRIKWFKSNYPDSLHVYLVRSPRDQWESYISKVKRNIRIFVAYDLMIAGKNQHTDYFRRLADYVPLIDFRDADLNAEIKFYQTLSDQYTDEDKYFIFYYIWLSAYLENCQHADIIIDMNSISRDPAYRQQIIEKLQQRYGIYDSLFDDSQMREYSTHTLSPEVMKNIEATIQQVVFSEISDATLGQLKKGMSDSGKNYLHPVAKGRCGKLLAPDVTEKLQKMLIELNRKLVKCNFYESRNRALLERIGELEKRKKSLEALYESRTYKIGKAITDPVRKIRDLLKALSGRFGRK